MGKLILSSLILLLLFPLSLLAVHSYQFENYNWSDSMQEIIEKVETKGHKLSIKTEKGLAYEDVIFNEKCEVSFYFTPQSKKLAIINIKWGTKHIGADLLNLLKETYSVKFGKSNEFIDKYNSEGATDDSFVALDYFLFKTELTYYGPYYRNYNQEQKAIVKDEGKGRF